MRLSIAAGVLASFVLPSRALAQGNVAQGAAATVQVEQSRAQNAALMRQYSWTERLEFLVNGQVKDLRIDTVNFAPDGKLQRTVLNDQSAPLPGGFLRRRVAENKKKEIEEYIQGLGKLLREYTLPTPGAVMNFMDTATPVPAGNGQLLITGQGVVQPGDSLSVWIDAATKKTKKVAVTSSYQGNPVNLTATFNTLPSGLNYAAYAQVAVPAKGYVIQVQNFDYVRN
ncbi:MAG TPA: hypothetical protein VMT17_18075 [Anaeromyxobacteraceae bacterium]|nr:hypothetical protein [Anaeromyxobacteraceae bacterium]